jgi:hypothetical protein
MSHPQLTRWVLVRVTWKRYEHGGKAWSNVATNPETPGKPLEAERGKGQNSSTSRRHSVSDLRRPVSRTRGSNLELF